VRSSRSSARLVCRVVAFMRGPRRCALAPAPRRSRTPSLGPRGTAR
jgi:hypothetical protein